MGRYASGLVLGLVTVLLAAGCSDGGGKELALAGSPAPDGTNPLTGSTTTSQSNRASAGGQPVAVFSSVTEPDGRHKGREMNLRRVTVRTAGDHIRVTLVSYQPLHPDQFVPYRAGKAWRHQLVRSPCGNIVVDWETHTSSTGQSTIFTRVTEDHGHYRADVYRRRTNHGSGQRVGLAAVRQTNEHTLVVSLPRAWPGSAIGRYAPWAASIDGGRAMCAPLLEQVQFLPAHGVKTPSMR